MIKIKIFSNRTFHYNDKILMNSSAHSYYLQLQSIKQHDELLVTKSVYRPIIILRIRNLFPELSREELARNFLRENVRGGKRKRSSK